MLIGWLYLLLYLAGAYVALALEFWLLSGERVRSWSWPKVIVHNAWVNYRGKGKFI